MTQAIFIYASLAPVREPGQACHYPSFLEIPDRCQRDETDEKFQPSNASKRSYMKSTSSLNGFNFTLTRYWIDGGS